MPKYNDFDLDLQNTTTTSNNQSPTAKNTDALTPGFGGDTDKPGDGGTYSGHHGHKHEVSFCPVR